MNLFLLSWNPTECAIWHCDKHVVKMILELVQMLYTAWQINNDTNLPSSAPLCKSTGQPGYKKLSNPNHPMAKWVRESIWNYKFTIKLASALAIEFKFRYNKYHACTEHVLWLSLNLPKFSNRNKTEIPQCMPDEYKCKCPITAYRNYYIYEKHGFAKWYKRNAPYWWYRPHMIDKLKDHLNSIHVNHEIEILKEETLKSAHMYCVINNISSQQYGPMLEKYIISKCKYSKNKPENCTGDCINKEGINVEIKVSLGGAKHIKFNYVQIRPFHACDIYILTAYHLCNDNVDTGGELYIFSVPKEELIKLIVSYGSYAHGTIKELGKITEESMINTNKEYSLRPYFNDSCWNALISFRVQESLLYK